MIIIPMAGLSSRFFNAGYDKPKYMLKAFDEYLFDHAVNSFKHYFDKETFIFIIRDTYKTYDFVKKRIKALGITKYHISILQDETRGQAETVALALKTINYQGSITIFNIDTFRPNFVYPKLDKLNDGYIEVFEGSGDNWSFAKPLSVNSTVVSKTAEKQPISNLCSTGLYYFSQVEHYLDAYEEYLMLPKSQWAKGELYIAPLYNLLIEKGLVIHYHLIQRTDVIFCGTPDEYNNFLQTVN